VTLPALALALLLAPPAAPRAPAAAHRYDAEAMDALAAMEKAAAATNDYTMRLVRRELRETVLSPAETIDIKWQRPQRIYLKAIDGPRERQEVLYAPGWNKNKIKVHGGGFPYFTVNLDPYGTLAMARSHHPIPEVSLVQLVGRILDNVRRAKEKNEGSLTFVGRESLFDRPVVKLEVTAPPTGTTPSISAGQTLWDLARATGQSMYVILHANRARGWTQADHAKPGDAVLVPEFYSGRLVLWIDEELHLPIQADIYDHEGQLYEHYEHHDLKINVGLTDADFDPKNASYHF
jgi:hypothetical protein